MRIIQALKARKEARDALSLFGLLALLFAFTIATALAQTRPTQSPVYQPNGILAQKSFTAAGTYVYTVNGDGVVTVEVTGSGSGIVAEFDVSGDRSASPTWNSLGPITANGNYRFDVSSYAQARFNITALTSGTVTVAMSGSQAQRSLKNGDMGAVLTSVLTSDTGYTATVPGTYTTQTFINAEGNGVVCTFDMSSSSGSPTTSFAIQEYDSASNTFVSLVTSGTITGGGGKFTGLPTVLMVYPGIATTGLPTQTTAASLHLPYLWNVTETTGGTLNPAQASTVGCQVLK